VCIFASDERSAAGKRRSFEILVRQKRLRRYCQVCKEAPDDNRCWTTPDHIEGTPAVHLKRFCDTAVEEDKSITKTLSIIKEIRDRVATPDEIARELNRRGIGWPAGKWSPREFEWDDFLVGKMDELAVKRQDWNGSPVEHKTKVRVR
jgi:hypothetical protein